MRLAEGFPRGVLERLGILAGLAALAWILSNMPVDMIAAAVLGWYSVVGMWLENNVSETASLVWALTGWIPYLASMVLLFWGAYRFARFVLRDLVLAPVLDTFYWLVGMARLAVDRLRERRRAGTEEGVTGLKPGMVIRGLSLTHPLRDERLEEHLYWDSPDPEAPVTAEEAAFVLELAFPNRFGHQELRGMGVQMAGLSWRELHARIRAMRAEREELPA